MPTRMGYWASLMAVLSATCVAMTSAAGAEPERVTFVSADGNTTLTGYLYKLSRSGSGRAPAVVMMHGRAGAYSQLADGVYNASTLSMRHQAWGQLWAENGYVALLVDGFGHGDMRGGFLASVTTLARPNSTR